MTKPPTTRPGSATFFQTPQRIAAPRRLEAPDPGGELGDHIFWQAQTAYDSASKDSAIYIYVAVAPVHAKLCRAKGNGKFRKSTLGAFEVHLDWRSYFLAAFVRRLRVKCLGRFGDP